jgi:hypothetical protein
MWVSVQRIFERKGRLSATRKARLDALGFDWDPFASAWENAFTNLTRYKERFGDCSVPQKWKENPELAVWVLEQRNLNKKGELPAPRKARLDALGFVWHPHDHAWETMFADLMLFKDRFGHCNVSRSHEKTKLAMWVNNQRHLARDGRLSSARKARLEELGFEWEIRESSWETMYSDLERLQQRFGNCDVPQKWAEHPRLGSWVNVQRELKRGGKLSTEREARLNAIGFNWEARASRWESNFIELKCHKDKTGSCNFPEGDNPKVAAWVQMQRRLLKTGKLPSARKLRLDAIGFEWNPYDSVWEAMLTELERYKEEHGDCNVPRGWKPNPALANWVKQQRRVEKEGKLVPTRKVRLDAIGFLWGPPANKRLRAAE